MEPSDRPPRPRCKDLVHFNVSAHCNYCGEINHAADKAAIFYCKDFPTGTWELCHMAISHDEIVDQDPSASRDKGICWCDMLGEDKCSDGFVLLHQKCLELLNYAELSAERIDYLGRAVAWMNHDYFFRGFHKEYLNSLPKTLDYRHDTISYVGRKLGLSLGCLPLELLRHIQSYCRYAPFWQIVKHLDVTPLPGTIPRSKMSSVSLARVVRWKRGDAPPVLSKEEATSGHVRVTVDRRGFCQIEHLPEYPPVCLDKHRCQRFAILEMHQASMATAYFKDGMGWIWKRLSLKHFYPWTTVTLWDIPTPPTKPFSWPHGYFSISTNFPNPETCSMLNLDHLGGRFDTINLRDVVCLKFRFKPCVIQVKAFNKAEPLSQIISENDYLYGESSYLPLASNDRILWIQARGHKSTDERHVNVFTSLLVKTELSGIVHLGQCSRKPAEIMAFSQVPLAIFCGSHQFWSIDPAIAIYPKSDPSTAHEVPSLRNIGPPTPATLLYYGRPPPSWSWAPLEDITCVRVFTSVSLGGCFLGMEIAYRNGGQRFIGDISEGTGRVPNVERVENPTRFYIEDVPHTRGRKEVVFFNDSEESKREEQEYISSSPEDWTRYTLVGELHYWYDSSQNHEVRVLPPGSWRGQVE